MKRLMQRALALLRREDGANIVEFAFTCTFLLAMLIGIFEMSMALYTYSVVSAAAREASRYASVRGNQSCANAPSLTNCGASSTQIKSWLKQQNYAGLNNNNLDAVTTWCAANTVTTSTGQSTTWSACSGATAAAPGNMVNVAVTYPFTLEIPFLKNKSISILSTSQMVISQ